MAALLYVSVFPFGVFFFCFFFSFFLDGDVPRGPSYGVYISQRIRFARESNHFADFNARNKTLTTKLLQQGIGIIIIGKFLFLSFIDDATN